MTREEYEEKVKRRRAIRITLALVLVLPALGLTLFTPNPIRGFWTTWPLLWKVVFSVSFGLSLLAGWKPGKETWFGDQSVYVDEPEVDDGW